MTKRARLTHDQDGMLRRLTFFEQRGIVLAPPLRRLRRQLRARDLRTEVREPWETGVTASA